MTLEKIIGWTVVAFVPLSIIAMALAPRWQLRRMERREASLRKEEELRRHENERLLEAFREDAPPGMRCPLCKEERWEVGNILELRTFHKGLYLPGAAILPMVPCTCQACGNVALFSAIKLGLVRPYDGNKTYLDEDEQ